MRVDGSEGMRHRARAAASLSLFWAAQAIVRKLSLPGSLGWAEGALKRHSRNEKVNNSKTKNKKSFTKNNNENIKSRQL